MVCVRGASALGELLDRYPDANVQVLVIWEPVLDSDVGPPTDTVRAPLADPRVTEYWDPGLWMSKRAILRQILLAQAAGTEPPSPDDIAWDFIAIYPPGSTWEDPFPIPSAYDGPVIQAVALIDQTLAAATPR